MSHLKPRFATGTLIDTYRSAPDRQAWDKVVAMMDRAGARSGKK